MQRVACKGRSAEDGFGRRGWHAFILPGASAGLLGGCKGPLSALDPAGPSADAIATVWWWMLAVALLVLAAVVAMWLLAMRRAPARTLARDVPPALAGDETPRDRRWIVGGGIVLPSACIAALVVWGSGAGLHQLPLALGEAGAAAPLRVEITGHQWWWEVHYPGTGVRLRDEVRVPVGQPVDFRTSSRDVIHSFWVPRLGGKLDAIPGRTPVVRLQADQPGTFRGQCAEFCGLGHAGMALTVVAMERADFEAWLAMQSVAPALSVGPAE